MDLVLIGVLDQRIEEDQVSLGWDINRVGGRPTWLNSGSMQPLPHCKNCGRPSSLVLQMYCPLGGSPYHRCLYLFVCPGNCSRQGKGWRVFRSMKLDLQYLSVTGQVNQPTHPPCAGLNDVWDQDQDDWGDGPDDGGPGSAPESLNDTALYSDVLKSGVHVGSDPNIRCPNNPPYLQSLESFSQLTLASDVEQGPLVCDSGDSSFDVCGDTKVTETLGLADAERWQAMTELLNTKLTQESQPTISTPEIPVVFEPFFLSVLEEPEEEYFQCDHLIELIQNYEKSEGKQIQLMMAESLRTIKDQDKSETYERTELRHGDKVFHKFLRRLQRCPLQCIRYHRGGDPLLVSTMPEASVNKCEHCQGQRVFEFQVVPQLIPFMKTQDGTPCEIEFGTVLVLTCERNCWPADLDPASELDLLEEAIIVQGDPDSHLYK